MVQFHEARIIVLDILINIHYKKNQINFVSLFDGPNDTFQVHQKANSSLDSICFLVNAFKLMLVKIFKISKNLTGDLYRLKCEN